MTDSTKRMIGVLVALAVIVVGALVLYQTTLRKVRLAFIGFPDSQWANFEEAGLETPYSLHKLAREDLDSLKLESYSAALIWGMGFNPSPEQAANMERAAGKGANLVIYMGTSEEARRHGNIGQERQDKVIEYLKHGGQENIRSMMDFLAHELAGRRAEPDPVAEKPEWGFFHLGDVMFQTLEEYEAYLDQIRPGIPEDAPRLAIVGTFVNPTNRFERPHLDRMIRDFEKRGVRVYPVFGFRRALNLLKEADPDLAVVMPHGRLAQNNQVPGLLAELDIPCVGALSLLADEESWLADPQGLAGGFLSQSVTMPELDGVIEPVVIASRDLNERGLQVPKVIEDRMQKLVARTMNWLELRTKPNAEKKVVIVYYKSPGMAAVAAAGLETAPSLFNLLKHLQDEGYDLGGQLPADADALYEMIQTRGKTLGQWAIGSFEKFLVEADPELIPARTYGRWFQDALSPLRQQETLDLWGPVPGKLMVTDVQGEPHLVVSRIELGNVVIMPQPTVGTGASDEDEIETIHGTDQAAPHFYLGAYLWARNDFEADAIVHFGTHGSLEFTYGKSVCMSRDCWPDILIGDVPHIYPYIINNVGEAMVAKRRAYGVTVSHNTPPFTESGIYGDLVVMHEKLHTFDAEQDPLLKLETRRTIGRLVHEYDLARDIELPEEAGRTRLLSDAEIDQLSKLVHEMESKVITDGLHVIGRPYTQEQMASTVTLMVGEPGYEKLLGATGHPDDPILPQAARDLTRNLVDGVMAGEIAAEQFFDADELAQLRDPDWVDPEAMPAGPTVDAAALVAEAGHSHGPDGHSHRPGGHGHGSSGHTHGADGHTHDARSFAGPINVATFWGNGPGDRPELPADRQVRLDFLEVLDEIEKNIAGLNSSPRLELEGVSRALRGGYIKPSSGGDALVNPSSVPTGRNLYSINAEKTPSEEAWRVGVMLSDQVLADHRARTGRWPQQVAFSLWGGEFIRSKGSTMAQVLYLLGVRPVRNSRGTVYDVEIIPSAELGRPRIDVLVQTSGQFRDAGASRIALLDKAVQLVAALPDEEHPNFVRDGVAATEMALKDGGMAPQRARELATARIFGSANNQDYGTGIRGMVEAGDTWDDSAEVAEQYLKNMGGIYRDADTWGTYEEGLLAAAMQGTEMVIHPRSSNTWGPLSLDHVYEFMGGLTAGIRHATGIDPTGYFSDQRTRGRAMVTTAVAAIREEARTTIWNPRYLGGMQREGAAAAAGLTESVRNMYGWNVMQPSTIDEAMWDETYEVMVADKHGLELQQFFERENPYALQDMSAVMLETARKGMWSPDAEVLQNLARLHADLVARYGAGCSRETCGNKKLQEFLNGQLMAPGAHVPDALVVDYAANLAAVLESAQPVPEIEGIELEERSERVEDEVALAGTAQNVMLAGGVVLMILVSLFLGARRKQRWE